MTAAKSKFDMYDPLSENFHRQEFPFYWVARVNALYAQEMERVLKKIDMDVPRWRIMMILMEQDRISISEIADQAVSKLPTATKILYRMRDQGLIELVTSPTDGRVTLASMTSEGRDRLELVRESVSGIFRRCFQGLTAAQIKRLNGLLEQLHDNMDPGKN
ncbi:MarR family winged helix-turn-helix transcriptional regulator [Marinobacterium sedimentorum]|uniref:MarR family winged helix-turn-helix transcriptional regulator n=1 Tax=Marinobacterium sedimentorum TaxID=2927804 RepID=UPI0020C6D0C7|nr:MarR family transcriptional regulator [Marinobacterium sedimentorum]MCP8687023.1 MarR family transcriptional regulator [Marinobacterium sedimentorum]